MARGWGRSEEDQLGDKEQEREGRTPIATSDSREIDRRKRRHSIQLSLARIEEQLANTAYPERRKALEAARADLLASLKKL